MSSPRVLLDADDLRACVERLAAEVSDAHPDGVLLIAVLKGALPFLADLARALTVPVEVDFLAVSAYQPAAPRVRMVKDLDTDISGRAVVVVEDVIDTGLSLAYLLGVLERRGPASLEVCALLDRRMRRIVPVEPRWIGTTIDAPYVVGYGLDHDGRYRNVQAVVEADLEALRADPDAYVSVLYER